MLRLASASRGNRAVSTLLARPVQREADGAQVTINSRADAVADFAGVRVHADGAAADAATAASARAFTVGDSTGALPGKIGRHGSRLEHEADRIANHVMARPASTSSPVAIQRDADKDLTADRVRDLKEYVASHPSPYKHVIQIIRFSQKQDLDDNVAADFVESLSAAQLEHFAPTPEGREMLDVLYNAMMTGHVTSHETLQADRILLYAKWKFSPAEVYKVAHLSDPDAAPTPIVLTARKRADRVNHLAASKRYRDVIAGVGRTVPSRTTSPPAFSPCSTPTGSRRMPPPMRGGSCWVCCMTP